MHSNKFVAVVAVSFLSGPFKICVPFDMYCIEKKKDIIITIIIIIIIIIITIIIIIIIIIIDQQENRYISETASKWLQKLKSLQSNQVKRSRR